MTVQVNQGVTAIAVAPFSSDCEVIAKFVGGMTSDIMYEEIDLLLE
jgi:hypothetical protein